MEELKNRKFKKNPNFRFKEVFKDLSCCFGINDIFDIYYDQANNNELYLITSDKDFKISITRIRDKQLIKSLPGIENHRVNMIRHFYNKNNAHDYLVVSFKDSNIKVWDLTNNYNLIHSFHVDYSKNSSIYSALLYFTDTNKNYIITCSNCNENKDFTKIYNFEDGSFLQNLELTNRIDIYYLLIWNNNNYDYLIQCCHSNVLIHNLENKELFNNLRKASNGTIHNSACIIKSEEGIDYLYVGNVNGLIDVWNLNTFQLKQSIKHLSSYYYHFLNWNDRFLIIAEKFSCSIIIFDTKYNKIINVLKDNQDCFVISVKKIDHPIYGECLLSSNLDNKLSLWTIS